MHHTSLLHITLHITQSQLLHITLLTRASLTWGTNIYTYIMQTFSGCVREGGNHDSLIRRSHDWFVRDITHFHVTKLTLMWHYSFVCDMGRKESWLTVRACDMERASGTWEEWLWNLSASQYIAACCSMTQGVAACCSVLQCAAVCCTVSWCAAVCCSVLQCVAAKTTVSHGESECVWHGESERDMRGMIVKSPHHVTLILVIAASHHTSKSMWHDSSMCNMTPPCHTKLTRQRAT